MDHNHSDELDQIIDRGLAHYAGAEPLAEFEDRILRRIRLAEAGRPSRWSWALVVPALAALAVVALLVVKTVSRPVRTPVAQPIMTARVAPPRPSIAPIPPLTRSTVRRARAPKPASRVLPKRDQFPTPAPLTAGEKALIALAQRQPAEVEAFASLQQRNAKDIEIPPIEIPPLRIDGNP